MPLRRPAPGDDMPSIHMNRPVESTFRIDGRLYRLKIWTRAQWDRLSPEDRPKVAWPHGTGWASVEPS